MESELSLEQRVERAEQRIDQLLDLIEADAEIRQRTTKLVEATLREVQELRELLRPPQQPTADEKIQ